eukprot:206060_1
MNGNYYSAGDNRGGACTVNDKSMKILNMTPITYFKQNNIKISQVFVNNRGDAPFWKGADGGIYTSCNRNIYGRVGAEVHKNKLVNKIPFLSQLSIKKMVSGNYCSIAICNDGSVYSTGRGNARGDNGLGANGVGNRSWERIECLKDIVDCDFGHGFVIFLSSSGYVFSAGVNDYMVNWDSIKKRIYEDERITNGLNTKEDMWNPMEIEFPNYNRSKYIKAMANQLKSSTPLPDAVVDVIIIYLPPVVPIV